MSGETVENNLSHFHVPVPFDLNTYTNYALKVNYGGVCYDDPEIEVVTKTDYCDYLIYGEAYFNREVICEIVSTGNFEGDLIFGNISFSGNIECTLDSKTDSAIRPLLASVCFDVTPFFQLTTHTDSNHKVNIGYFHADLKVTCSIVPLTLDQPKVIFGSVHVCEAVPFNPISNSYFSENELAMNVVIYVPFECAAKTDADLAIVGEGSTEVNVPFRCLSRTYAEDKVPKGAACFNEQKIITLTDYCKLTQTASISAHERVPFSVAV